jgi:hypothetical protein
VATEFELEGRRFEVKALAPEDSCLGLEILGKALGPALLSTLSGVTADMSVEEIGARIDMTQLVASLVGQASQLSALLKLFLPRTKFDRQSNGNLVELKLFTEEVFGGRIDVLIAFLVHAVRAEYTCFLGGGSALGPLLAAFVKPSKSPTAPTP